MVDSNGFRFVDKGCEKAVLTLIPDYFESNKPFRHGIEGEGLHYGEPVNDVALNVQRDEKYDEWVSNHGVPVSRLFQEQDNDVLASHIVEEALFELAENSYASPGFSECIALLSCIDLENVSRYQPQYRLAFFINLYQLMNLHAVLSGTFKSPQNHEQRLNFTMQVTYVVGNIHMSLHDIEQGILGLDYSPRSQFQASKPCSAFKCPRCRPRSNTIYSRLKDNLHQNNAKIGLALSSDAIPMVYNGAMIEEQLSQTTSHCVSQNAAFVDTSEQGVLSLVISESLARNQQSSHHIARFIASSHQDKILTSLVRDHMFNGTITVTVIPTEWRREYPGVLLFTLRRQARFHSYL